MFQPAPMALATAHSCTPAATVGAVDQHQDAGDGAESRPDGSGAMPGHWFRTRSASEQEADSGRDTDTNPVGHARTDVVAGSGHSPGLTEITVGAIPKVVDDRQSADEEALVSDGGRRLVALVIGLVLCLAVGFFGAQLLRHGGGSAATGTSAPSATTTSAQPSDLWRGEVERVQPNAVTASCTADPVNFQGQLVSYDARNLVDNQNATAWRCDGSGVNQTITFTFNHPTRIAGVGLINGYDKTVQDGSLYERFRRVLSVRWGLPDGSFFVQNLSDNNSYVQELSIAPRTVSGQVTMTILSSSPSAADERHSDAVLLSEVFVYGPR